MTNRFFRRSGYCALSLCIASTPYFLYLRSNAGTGRESLKIQTILQLALASPVFGCGGQLSSDEAGLLDAVAFVTGGQEEGAAIPQGFETRWRRRGRRATDPPVHDRVPGLPMMT